MEAGARQWFVPQRLNIPRRLGFLTISEFLIGGSLAIVGNFLLSLGYGVLAAVIAVALMRAIRRKMEDFPHWRVLLYWFVSFGHKPFLESWKRVLRG